MDEQLRRWFEERREAARRLPSLVSLMGAESRECQLAADELATIARTFLADVIDPPRTVMRPTADRIVDLLDLLALARAAQAGPLAPIALIGLIQLSLRVANMFPDPATTPEAPESPAAHDGTDL